MKHRLESSLNKKISNGVLFVLKLEEICSFQPSIVPVSDEKLQPIWYIFLLSAAYSRAYPIGYFILLLLLNFWQSYEKYWYMHKKAE